MNKNPIILALDTTNLDKAIDIAQKIKNKIFAILAAPAAIPPKPNIPATIAKIINVIVQRNIIINF